jgi:hypothetical protein
MMNKSLPGFGRESSHKVFYGFHELRSFDNRQPNVRFHAARARESILAKRIPVRSRKNASKQKLKLTRENGKKEPPFPAAFEVITGRRQTEWTGATRCPKRTPKLIFEKA